jgi:hypothetical protein
MRCGRQTDGHTLLFRTFRLARSAVRHCKVAPIAVRVSAGGAIHDEEPLRRSMPSAERLCLNR